MRNLCDGAIWLENGIVREAGKADQVAGKAQGAWGDAKEKAKDLIDKA